MTLSSVVLVAMLAAFLAAAFAAFFAAMRSRLPDRPLLFEGMFRFEADLGWPRGVQEDDGERAWVPGAKLAGDPVEDGFAWAAVEGSSVVLERDGDRPLVPVPTARVEGGVSAAPRRRAR